MAGKHAKQGGSGGKVVQVLISNLCLPIASANQEIRGREPGGWNM